MKFSTLGPEIYHSQENIEILSQNCEEILENEPETGKKHFRATSLQRNIARKIVNDGSPQLSKDL